MALDEHLGTRAAVLRVKKVVAGLDKVGFGPKVMRELAVDVEVTEGSLVGYVVLICVVAGLVR